MHSSIISIPSIKAFSKIVKGGPILIDSLEVCTSNKPFCNLKNMKDCDFLSPEDTKMSNPPCTLRGTGWNRWEWLCEDPQKNSLIPFETGINNRIVVKDNHRPCIPTPLDLSDTLPKSDEACVIPEDWPTYQDKAYPFIHWRCCGEIEKY